MAQPLQTLAYTYSDLAAATNPRLALASDTPETPLTTATGGGADVDAVLIADVGVSIGESPWWRVCRITVDTYDNAATYTYNQNGTAVAVAAAAATLPVFLAAWAAAINASGITATAEVYGGDSLLISQREGGVNVWQSIAVSATGTAVLTSIADADAAVATVYARSKNTSAVDASTRSTVLDSVWRLVTLPDGTPAVYAVPRGGLVVSLPVSTYAAITVLVSDVTSSTVDTGVTYAPRTVVLACQPSGSAS